MDNKDESTLASQSQAAQPSKLTDEQIIAVVRATFADDTMTSDDFAFARAIEEAAISVHLAGQSQATRAVPAELAQVQEQIKNGAGFWHTCSGCHESEDGHDNGSYPYSTILGCKLGMGCSECGGIGAVWDNTDYEAMHAEDLTPTTSTVSAPEEVRNQALEEAAEMCDGLHYNWRWDNEPDSDSGPRNCAREIRALKRTTSGKGEAA